MAEELREMNRRLAAALKRLQDRHHHMHVDIDFGTLMILVAHLQLALRHPGNEGEGRKVVRGFLDHLFAQLETEEPELVAILRAGDNPAFDVPPAAEVQHD